WALVRRGKSVGRRTARHDRPPPSLVGGLMPGITFDAGDSSPSTANDATRVGRLLAAIGTADVVDAHVVICARRSNQRVVTSDPDDLRALDSTLEVVVV